MPADSVVIALLGQDGNVIERLARAEKVMLSAVVFGELIHDALRSRHAATSIAKLENLAATTGVLPRTARTARAYGEIKSDLHARGRPPIAENDMWIAAVAREHELILVSRDQHSGEVVGLRTERW